MPDGRSPPTGYHRPDAKDLIVIFTDGQAHDAYEAKQYAASMKKMGVKILGIGAGHHLSRFISDLEEMSSGPENVFTFSFANLNESVAQKIVADISKEICLATELTTPTPAYAQTATEMSTTKAPTTTEVPTTIERLTTTKVPTTTEAPTTTGKLTTTTEMPTTTEAPTTTPKATTKPTTTEAVTTTPDPTTEPTTRMSTTLIPTNISGKFFSKKVEERGLVHSTSNLMLAKALFYSALAMVCLI